MMRVYETCAPAASGRSQAAAKSPVEASPATSLALLCVAQGRDRLDSPMVVVTRVGVGGLVAERPVGVRDGPADPVLLDHMRGVSSAVSDVGFVGRCADGAGEVAGRMVLGAAGQPPRRPVDRESGFPVLIGDLLGRILGEQRGELAPTGDVGVVVPGVGVAPACAEVGDLAGGVMSVSGGPARDRPRAAVTVATGSRSSGGWWRSRSASSSVAWR
jgi:hypothetical protein